MKNYTRFLVLGVFALSTINTYSQIINTFAGNGVGGFSGNGGPAINAEVYNPCGLANDAAGNLYIADESSNTIRKVNTSGIITKIAGIGLQAGLTGDGGPATAAELDSPQGVGVDSHGNIYIADWANGRVRKVNTAGIISTFAGSTPGYGGDGGPATSANLAATSDVAADSLGNVYIADEGNSRVRVVNSSGIITTFAGTGLNSYSGDGGPASAAEISKITGVITDAFNNVYIADVGNNRIRMVNTNGIISTVAGNGIAAFNGDGGPATSAEISAPGTVWVDITGTMYIADQGNQLIRMVNTSGIITTVAGNGGTGYTGDGGPATSAEFNGPFGISSNGTGEIFIGDVFNNRVRFVTVPVTTEVQNNNITGTETMLYPNPNNGLFAISISNYVFKKANIIIYNILGEKIYSILKPLTPHDKIQIDMENQPNGIYIYRIVDENNNLAGTGRFIKE